MYVRSDTTNLMTPDRAGGGGSWEFLQPRQPRHRVKRKVVLKFPGAVASNETVIDHMTTARFGRYRQDTWWGRIHLSLWTRKRPRRQCHGKEPTPDQVVAPYLQGFEGLDRLTQSFGVTTSGPRRASLREADDSQLENSGISPYGNSERKTVEPFDHVDSSWKGFFALAWKNHPSVWVRGGTNVAGKCIAPEKAFGVVICQTKFLFLPFLQVSWLSCSWSASPLRVRLKFEIFSVEESPFKLTRNPNISADPCWLRERETRSLYRPLRMAE